MLIFLLKLFSLIISLEKQTCIRPLCLVMLRAEAHEVPDTPDNHSHKPTERAGTFGTKNKDGVRIIIRLLLIGEKPAQHWLLSNWICSLIDYSVFNIILSGRCFWPTVILISQPVLMNTHTPNAGQTIATSSQRDVYFTEKNRGAFMTSRMYLQTCMYRPLGQIKELWWCKVWFYFPSLVCAGHISTGWD